MPNRPKRLCLFAPCRVRVDRGYCEKHEYLEPQKKWAKKKKTDPFYQTPAWIKTSKLFRMRYPVCAECERQGRITSAQCVDHIIPIKDGGEELNWSNLQSLCLACHTRKTRKEAAG